MKITNTISIIIAVLILLIDNLMFVRSPFFIPVIVIAIIIGSLPFWLEFFEKQRKQKEIESMFPEFVRNLVGAIKSGMPAPKAITHVAGEDYGALTPHVKKLANQITWSIPLHNALQRFADETRNPIIRRTVSTVIEAEESGGNIEEVLESITQSVINIKRIKEQREAAIHSQVVQSYIIFLVFIVVLIVIQNLLMPYIAKMQQTTIPGLEESGSVIKPVPDILTKVRFDLSSPRAFFISFGRWMASMRGIFLMIAVIQGFFAGIVLGKLSEGEFSAGFKHSLTMIIIAFLIITIAQGFL